MVLWVRLSGLGWGWEGAGAGSERGASGRESREGGRGFPAPRRRAVALSGCPRVLRRGLGGRRTPATPGAADPQLGLERRTPRPAETVVTATRSAERRLAEPRGWRDLVSVRGVPESWGGTSCVGARVLVLDCATQARVAEPRWGPGVCPGPVRCRERPDRVVWRGGRHPPRTGARVVPSSPGRRRLFTPQTQHAGHPLKQAQNCPPPTSAPTRLRDLMAQSLLKAPARVSLAPPVSPAPACLRVLRLSYSADYPMTHFEGHLKSLLRVQTTDLKGSAPPSFPLPCFFSVGLLTIQHS